MASSTEIHGVRWQEVCPWLLLVRAVRISLYIRVLALALVGVLLTQVGWHAATLAMKAPDRWTWSAADAPLVVWGALDPARRSSSAPDRIREETDRAFSAHAIFFATDHPFLRGWAWSMQPACRVREATTGRDRACLVAAQAWTLAVWGVVGVAIARIAVLSLVREESLALGAAVAFSLRRWTTAVLGPLMTIAGVLIVGLPLVGIGLAMRADWSAAALATVWGVAFLLGLVLVAGGVGLILGWPLMLAAAAVDARDAYDGISRAYGYVFQRPLHLLWYLLVIALFGFLAGWLVEAAASATVAVTEGVVGYSAGADRAAELLDGDGRIDDRDDGWARAARRGWRRLLDIAVGSYALALFWPAVTAIYLLLRQQVDDTELDAAVL